MKIIYRGSHSNNAVFILGKRGKIEEMIPFTTEEDLQQILPQKRNLNEILARLPSNKKVNFPIPMIIQPGTTQIEQAQFQTTFASPQTPTQSATAGVPQAITIAEDQQFVDDDQFDQFCYDDGNICGSGNDYSGAIEF